MSILPKDLVNAIDTLVKYGAKKSTLDDFVYKLVSKDLKQKPVSKPLESNGSMQKTLPTIKLPKTHYKPKTINEVTEIQKQLGAMATDSISDVSESILLTLCDTNGYKTWITCKHLSSLVLRKCDEQTQIQVRGELYKLKNLNFVSCEKRDTKDRKGMLHYSITNKGEQYLNKKTGGK